MRWIAIGVAAWLCASAAACANPVPETYRLSITEDRADTVLEINGAAIDGGGAAPRVLTIAYDFASAADAEQASYLLESFAGGSKLADLTVAPRGCDGTETESIDVALGGTITSTGDDCAP